MWNTNKIVFWLTHLIVMFLEIDFDKMVERLERFIDDVIAYNLPWFLFVCLSLFRSIYHPRGHAHLSAFVAPEREYSTLFCINNLPGRFFLFWVFYINVGMKVNSGYGNNIFGSPHRLFSNNKIILFYCGRQEECTIIIILRLLLHCTHAQHIITWPA